MLWPELLQRQPADVRHQVVLNDLPVPRLRAQGERRLNVVAQPAPKELLHGVLARVDERVVRNGRQLCGGSEFRLALLPADSERPPYSFARLRVPPNLEDNLPRAFRPSVHPGHYASLGLSRKSYSKLATPIGFEPTISTLTGWRVRPGYTTGPQRADHSIGVSAARPRAATLPVMPTRRPNEISAGGVLARPRDHGWEV